MNFGRRRPRGFGLKEGKQVGRKAGGLGRNRTDNCRHPQIKKRRK